MVWNQWGFDAANARFEAHLKLVDTTAANKVPKTCASDTSPPTAASED